MPSKLQPLPKNKPTSTTLSRSMRKEPRGIPMASSTRSLTPQTLSPTYATREIEWERYANPPWGRRKHKLVGLVIEYDLVPNWVTVSNTPRFS